MDTHRLGIFLIAIFFSIVPLSVFAADVQTGKIVSVPVAQIAPDNVYLAGGQILFLTTAQKDLTAAGGQVLVNGPVWGDALLAGGTLEILQPVKGDVRAAGGQITIANSVSGDVLVAGGTVIILPGVVVGGDVIAAGGVVDIEGTVNGSVRAYGGEVTLNGMVAGPVTIHASKQVTFGDATVIGSTLAYFAPQEANVAMGAKLGSQVTYSKNGEFTSPFKEKFAGVLFGILGFLVLAKFFAILLTSLIFVLVFKTSAQMLVEKTLAHFWKKVGIGFLALVAVPVATIILLITLVGVYLAFAFVLIYLLALFAAGVYMCVFTGALLARWIKKEAIADWKWTLLGTVVVFILAFVPFVGWIATFLLLLASFGTVVMSAKRGVEALK